MRRRLLGIRRRLLTRCAWCHGRFDKTFIGRSGTADMFHRDCAPVEHAHGQCLCDDPLTRSLRFGPCLLCGKYRSSDPDDADRFLASLPDGARITDDIRPQIEALWAERRRKRTAA